MITTCDEMRKKISICVSGLFRVRLKKILRHSWRKRCVTEVRERKFLSWKNLGHRLAFQMVEEKPLAVLKLKELIETCLESRAAMTNCRTTENRTCNDNDCYDYSSNNRLFTKASHLGQGQIKHLRAVKIKSTRVSLSSWNYFAELLLAS